MVNRRLTLPAAAEAIDVPFDTLRQWVIKKKIEAWVYGEDGIEPYVKKTGEGRHSIIFVYEKSLGHLTNPLPPPSKLSPPSKAEILLKREAAKYLGCSQHWLHNLAEIGRVRAYIYDKNGIDLIPLTEFTANQRRGRVLHFLKSDLENYKISIEEYKDDPLMPRLRQSFTDDEKRQIIAMANEQLKTKSYVSMRPIREALALPPTMYDDAIRRLREEQGWPMSHLQQQVSKARTKRNRTERKTK
jgi:hypothetical protein